MLEIHLNGPHGNAYALMAIASDFGKQLGYSPEEIEGMISEMKSGDYGHLLNVFNRHFKYVARLTGLTEDEAEDYGVLDIVETTLDGE